MQSLDVRTAFFICTGFIAIYGIGMMLFARNVSASFNGLYLFAMANFSLAIGFSLLFLMDYIDILWSILVANTFILLGAILIYHAHLRFINYPNNPLLLSVFLLISTFCLHSFFLYINPNANNRIIVTSIVQCLLFSLTAKSIHRIQQQTQKTCYTPLKIIAVFFALFFAIRIVVTLFSEPIHPYKLANGIMFYTVVMVVVMFYIVALNFFIVLISTGKLVHKVAELAYKDSLTALYNRRGLDNILQNKAVFEKPLTIIMCDIDHFKSVNDRYGHSIGDIVLREFSQLIKEVTRKTDICTRWGGEEFLIIMPLLNAQEAFVIAEKIRSTCEQYRFSDSEQQSLQITSSFGICSKQDNHGLDELICDADTALYQAKTQGRNRVCIFSSEMNK
ncbi:MAG: GGDEF domain-containing protein [Methylococcales bacterium]